MAATIGALMVDIGANVARLQRDMNQAQSTVSRAASKITSTARTMAGVLGVSFGVAAMVKAGKETLQLADKYAKMSRSVGISVESLSALDHAAQLSGTTFESVAKSSIRLAANMKDVRDGTGEAKDAFTELNISAVGTDGKLRSTEAVLLDIANRFKEMDDGTRKTALAVDIFGRSGAELIPLLNNGSAGIREMMDEAERLGVTFDTKTAQAAERINDQFFRFDQALKGMSQQTMVRLLPDIEQMSNLLFAAASNAGEMDYASRILSTSLKLLMTTGIGVISTFDTIGSSIGATAAAIAFWVEGDMKSANRVLIMGAEDAADKVVRAMERIQKVWASTPAVVEPVKTEIVNNLDTIEKESKKKEKSLESYMSESAKATEQYISGAFDQAADSIVSFSTTGKASFRDFANSVIQDIARIYVKQQLLGPLMNQALGAFGAVAVSGASNYYDGILNSGATAGELSSYFSTNARGGVYSSPSLSKYSNGVYNSPHVFAFASGAGVFAENGPEAIMPLTRIGGKLGVKAQGGSGSNIQNNMTMNLDLRGATKSDAQAISEAAQYGAKLALAEFKNDMKRGGQLYSSTRG